eukprot:20943-Eustigmatos_ZCMA.PRE.1
MDGAVHDRGRCRREEAGTMQRTVCHRATKTTQSHSRPAHAVTSFFYEELACCSADSTTLRAVSCPMARPAQHLHSDLNV